MFMSDPSSSPAGAAASTEPIRRPPAVPLPRALQMLRISRRQIEFVFRARREPGEVFEMQAGISGGAVVSCHPEHARHRNVTMIPERGAVAVLRFRAG